MKSVNQNGAMAFLGLLMVVLYYVFLQQDLISTTQVITSKCLDSSSAGLQLCISCIQRSQLNIANESSIHITDNANQFKIMTIPREGFFTCQQLLQFVSYQLPMEKASDIKFEQLGPTKQIIQMLDIQISDSAMNKFEAESQKQSVAVFQVKKGPSVQTTLITYSSQEGEVWARYYGQIIAECSMILAIFCIFYYRIKQKEIKLSCIGSIFISFMILSESMLSNTNYLINYSIALVVGFYFAASSMPRTLTVIPILLFVAADYFNFQTQCLIVIFLTYLILGNNPISKRVCTFVECCIAALFVCSAFREHHHWLSLPLRKVIEYTIICLSPLLIIMIKSSGDQLKYERLPNGKQQGQSSNSGLSLPGFQQEDSGDQQQK